MVKTKEGESKVKTWEKREKARAGDMGPQAEEIQSHRESLGFFLGPPGPFLNLNLIFCEQMEILASGDAAGPRPRLWVATIVNSGNKRGKREQATILVSISASGS